MDKVSDILKNIKDRLSSPFIFSFLLSWLVYNWQVTIALIWFNPDQIKRAGYTSIFDLINCRISVTPSWTWPLLVAFLYTLVWPIVRNWFAFVQAWAEKWGDEGVLKRKREGVIPTAKYLKLRKEYDKRSEILERNIANEEATIASYESEKTKRLAAEQDKIELQNTIQQKDSLLEEQRKSHSDLITLNEEKLASFKQEIAAFTDSKTIEGTWQVRYLEEPYSVDFKYTHFSKDVQFPIIPYPPLPSGGVVNHYFLIALLQKEDYLMVMASTYSNGEGKRFYNLEKNDNGWKGFENERPIILLPRDIQAEAANTF